MKRILSILLMSLAIMFSMAYANEGNGYGKIKNTKPTLKENLKNPSVLVTYYQDSDGDGYGDPGVSQEFPGSPDPGWVLDNTDCDDTNAEINPTTVWYIDADGDGYGASASSPTCTRPTDGFLLSELSGTGTDDCDDTNAAINPTTVWYIDSDGDGYGASASSPTCTRPTYGFLLSELSGTGTDDCDDTNGNINPTTVWYIDADGDGYGASASSPTCTRPTDGFLLSELSGTGTDDCDDTNAAINPTTVWYIDADGDGYGASASSPTCTRPTDGFLLSELSGTGTDDCDDTNAAINPTTVWYIDADGDGYGASASSPTCTRPTDGFLLSELSGTGTDDCDDTNAAINPTTVWYIDADGDGYGASASSPTCTRPTDGFLLSELSGTGTDDCDDTNAAINPTTVWYIDADGDGYGASASSPTCTRPTDGFLLSELSGTGTDDCDDTDANINPTTEWYIDADGDTYGGSSTTACERPTDGYHLNELATGSTGTDDCDDTNAAINPAATEVAGNTVDENCDGILGTFASSITVNSPHSYQYSDPEDNSKPIRIHITDENGNPLPDGTEVSIVAYNQKNDGTKYYGGNITSDPIILTVTGGKGFAETATKLSDLFPLLEARKIDKQDDPASWPRAYIDVTYAGEDGFYDPSERIASIVVRRENGNFTPLGSNIEADRIKFNGIAGSGYIVTSNTSENVKFTVKIADIADGYPGNINKAKVKFVLNPAGSTQETVLYDTDGFVDGVAEVTFNVSCGTLGANPYNVQVFLEGNYRGRLNTTLTMHKTNSSEVISAGGDMQLLGSKGLYAGTDGSVARFGFGAKYNKTATNVQGKATLIFISKGRTYQVTGNGTPIITMDATTGLATYNSKASITDVTNDGADATVSAINSPSGLRMEYTMTDAIPDVLSVRVYDATTTANTLWFSNKGTGSLSDKQSLTRGGVTVKASTTTTGPKTGGKKEISNVSSEMMNESMIVRIIPNPSATDFTLYTNGNGNERVQVRLMDISGRLLKQYEVNSGSTLKFGQELRNGMYIVQMIQNGKAEVFRIVKQQ